MFVHYSSELPPDWQGPLKKNGSAWFGKAFGSPEAIRAPCGRDLAEQKLEQNSTYAP
jgi:hypothetical protein